MREGRESGDMIVEEGEEGDMTVKEGEGEEGVSELVKLYTFHPERGTC